MIVNCKNGGIYIQGGRASGANVGGTGNLGANGVGGNNANGMDKSRTTQANSGDMSSSNRPGWFLYPPMNSVKSTTNLGDAILLLICMSTTLLSALQ